MSTAPAWFTEHAAHSALLDRIEADLALAEPAPLFAAPACELADLVGRDLAVIAAGVAEALECDKGHDPAGEVTDVAAGLDPAGSVVLAAVIPDGREIEVTVKFRRL